MRVFAKIGGLNKAICFYKYHRHLDVCCACLKMGTVPKLRS